MPNKYRTAAARAQSVEKAWESLAPEATFAELTLPQYRNKIKPLQDARDEFAALSGQLRAKREEIGSAEAAVGLTIKQVVSAVRADPAYGSDSPLLGAMNYVTDSRRKSGLTKKSNGNGNGNGNGTGTAPATPVAPAELAGTPA